MGLREIYDHHRLKKALDLLSSCKGNILDAGCGSGLIERQLMNRNIIGLDISVQALHNAKKQTPYVNYIAADIKKMPLKEECIDNVAMIAVLGALPRNGEIIAFGEAMRIMKNGGNLILLISQKHPFYSTLAPDRLFTRWRWRHFGPPALRNKLHGNGFRVNDMIFIAGPISLIVDLIMSFWGTFTKGLNRLGLRRPNPPMIIYSWLMDLLALEFHHFGRLRLLARYMYIIAQKV